MAWCDIAESKTRVCSDPSITRVQAMFEVSPLFAGVLWGSPFVRVWDSAAALIAISERNSNFGFLISSTMKQRESTAQIDPTPWPHTSLSFERSIIALNCLVSGLLSHGQVYITLVAPHHGLRFRPKARCLLLCEQNLPQPSFMRTVSFSFCNSCVDNCDRFSPPP